MFDPTLLKDDAVLRDLATGKRWLEYDPYQSKKNNEYYWRSHLMPDDIIVGRSDEGYETEEERDVNVVMILFNTYEYKDRNEEH